MKKDFSYGIVPVYKNEDGSHEFLIINQKAGNGSFWGFPKGHAENDESEIESAKREFVEEVGITDFDLIENNCFEVKYFFQEKGEKIHKTVKYRLVFVKDKKISIQTKELNGYKWSNFESAIKILTHENTKNILKKVVKEL